MEARAYCYNSYKYALNARGRNHMFGFKKELYTPEYQLAGDECAIIETSKGTIKVKFDG